MPIIRREKKGCYQDLAKLKSQQKQGQESQTRQRKNFSPPPRAAAPKAAPLASASNAQALELTPPEAAGDAESLGMGNGVLQWDGALGHGPKALGPKLSETCSCSALTEALAEDRLRVWQAINALRMHVGMAGNTLS